MNKQEMAMLLTKVQLGDNRHVDALVLELWLDTIGDLGFNDAIDALRRFRRERPGTYLEPGHLLEFAGVTTAVESPYRDITSELLEESKMRALAEAGVTVEEFEAHEHDVAWLREKFPQARGEIE